MSEEIYSFNNLLIIEYNAEQVNRCECSWNNLYYNIVVCVSVENNWSKTQKGNYHCYAWEYFGEWNCADDENVSNDNGNSNQSEIRTYISVDRQKLSLNNVHVDDHKIKDLENA